MLRGREMVDKEFAPRELMMPMAAGHSATIDDAMVLQVRGDGQ
jgi:hypothetical protein